MSKYPTVKLGDLCDVNMGQSPSSKSYNTNKNGLPFFQGNADFGEISPKIKIYSSAPIKIANKGDILFSVRAPIGAINIADRKCCIGRGLSALTPKNTTTHYLYFLLKAKKENIQSLGTGSTFKAINKNSLLSLLIPFHPIEEQNRISKKLNLIECTIHKRKQQLIKLDMLAKSRFIEMFGDNHSELVPLEQLCDFIRNGANIRQSKGSGGYPITRIETISNNVFNLDRLGYAGITTLDKYENYILKNGDILVSHINSEKYLGRAVQYKGQQKIIHGMNLLCVRPKETTIATFLEYYLRSKPTKEYISKITKKAVNQASFSVSDYKKLLVMNISKNECMAFNSFIEQLDKSKFRIKKSLEKLEMTYKALLQEYFG